MNSRQQQALRANLAEAWRKYERAKDRFAEITRVYREQCDNPTTAELKAANDYRRKKAADDCAWHGAEMQRYSGALTALLLQDLVDRLPDQIDFDAAVAEAQRLTVQEAQ